jgi:hypothetical protein
MNRRNALAPNRRRKQIEMPPVIEERVETRDGRPFTVKVFEPSARLRGIEREQAQRGEAM